MLATEKIFATNQIPSKQGCNIELGSELTLYGYLCYLFEWGLHFLAMLTLFMNSLKFKTDIQRLEKSLEILLFIIILI